MQQDLGKPFYEAMVQEIEWCKNECIVASKHLPKWIKDEKSANTPWLHVAIGPKIRKEPMGIVLIIG